MDVCAAGAQQQAARQQRVGVVYAGGCSSRGGGGREARARASAHCGMVWGGRLGGSGSRRGGLCSCSCWRVLCNRVGACASARGRGPGGAYHSLMSGKCAVWWLGPESQPVVQAGAVHVVGCAACCVCTDYSRILVGICNRVFCLWFCREGRITFACTHTRDKRDGLNSCSGAGQLHHTPIQS